MKMKISLWCALLVISISLIACTETLEVPKPRTYPKITLPEHQYKMSQPPHCPFAFKKNSYCVIDDKERPMLEEKFDDCWFNLYYPELKSDVFFTYVPIHSRKDYDKYVNDSYRIVNQVNKRSDYTDEKAFINKYGTSGVRFEFKGNAASPFQFYASDTSQHFVRAALYLNTKVDADSLAPIIQWLEEDMNKIIESFHWKD